MTQSLPPPHELADLPFWLVWRLVHRSDKKPLKVPYYANGNPRGAQNTEEDRGQLVTYAQALEAMRLGGYEGVGFAVVPAANIVVLDFDDCVEGGVIAPHVERLCEGTFTEISPSGRGVHAFFSGKLVSRKDVESKRGAFPIEVFGHTGFVTFTGNVTETCELFGFENTISPLTSVVLEEYAARGWDSEQEAATGPINALAALQPTLDISLADVAETLQKISPDIGYEDWVKCGMGIHQQTFASEEGFQIWHRWSAQSAKFKSEADCRFHWDSFGDYGSGKHLTFSFVMRLAKEAESAAKYIALDEMKAKIADCNDVPTLRERVCAEISRDDRIGPMEREDLANILKAKFKLLGTVYQIPMCRKLVAPAPRERVSGSELERPEWLRGFVYINAEDKFFRFDSGDDPLTQTSFNNNFNRFMPRNEHGRPVMTAVQAAVEDYCIETVSRGMYLPWANHDTDGIFEMNGVRYVNTYRPSSVPVAASSFTDSGREAIRALVQHIDLLCGGRREVRDHFIRWLAFCVQKPGVKIRHAVLVKGIEGDGKSAIGEMMAAIMGKTNVKIVTPKVLSTDFSDWAHGASLAVIEEVKLTGHNRWDIVNALKPNITNNWIDVHPKGKASVNVYNTMNQLLFTNFSDGLPLAVNDRRYFSIWTPFNTIDDFVRALQALGFKGQADYFDWLFKLLEGHVAELRAWFLEQDLSSFNPNSAAPMTDEKQQMIRMSESPEEEVIREIIEERADGVGADVLSSTCLLDQVHMMGGDVSVETTVLNRVLTRMGWSKLPKRVKWRGRVHRVWFRVALPENVQAALDATCSGQPGPDGIAGFTPISELF